MKKLSGWLIVNVVEYVFSRSSTPSNSIAARPLTTPRRIVGGCVGACTERLRVRPLLSSQRETGAPSTSVWLSASNQSARLLAIGGVGDGSALARSDPPRSTNTEATMAAAPSAVKRVDVVVRTVLPPCRSASRLTPVLLD